jgi:hypothetical protein
MDDVPTRQLDFAVMEAEVIDMDAPRALVNALDMLRAVASRISLMLPPPRATTDNTASDRLFNDIRGWLELNGVGWPRNEVGTQGRQFTNRITNAFFSLTTNMFTQMSDNHIAGICFSFCLLFIDCCTKCAVVPFPSPYNLIAFSDTILCQFIDKKLQD